MTKIRVEQIGCGDLKNAYNLAIGGALESHGRPPSGTNWSEAYGNHVSGKGCLRGTASCGKCYKRVDVTLQLEKIDAWDRDDKPAKAFNLLRYLQSIRVSGVECRSRG